MFCSVIIPTIGRDTVEKAVASVLAQPLPDSEIEVIVVNDSGRDLPSAPWQESPRVQVITTQRRERCVARNTGAAVARGDYLCFLDDDDWLVADGLAQLHALAQREPDAVWLSGAIQVVEAGGRVLKETNAALSGNALAQVMGGAWVPIQSSIIRTDAFFAVGGYNPHILGTEDQDLCRRAAAYGDFATTPAAVGCLLRGDSWQTSTNYQRAAADTRRSRDDVLQEPGAFLRMVLSADSPYWFGRLFKVCLSTVNHNRGQRRPWRILSRLWMCARVLLYAGRDVLTSDFRAAVQAEHVPNTLHFIMQELEQEGF